MSEERLKRVAFTLKSGPGKKVFVVGTFTDWMPRVERLHDNEGDGIYRTEVLLAPGRHEYKFLVDDAWLTDPENPDWVADGNRSLNSVITVE